MRAIPAMAVAAAPSVQAMLGRPRWSLAGCSREESRRSDTAGSPTDTAGYPPCCSNGANERTDGTAASCGLSARTTAGRSWRSGFPLACSTPASSECWGVEGTASGSVSPWRAPPAGRGGHGRTRRAPPITKNNGDGACGLSCGLRGRTHMSVFRRPKFEVGGALPTLMRRQGPPGQHPPVLLIGPSPPARPTIQGYAQISAR